MEPTDRILVVEDDAETRTLLQEYLEENGLRVHTLPSGAGLEDLLQTVEIDAIILDLMLPGEDGLSLCKRLSVAPATAGIPVIMLTARGGETDRILGLEMGADDYLPKPFSPRELLARIKSVLRRSRAMPRAARPREPTEILFSGWTLHLKARQLTSPDGVEVPLTRGEFQLLSLFLDHPNESLDRDRIMAALGQGETALFERSIDVQVGRLRKRLRDNPRDPHILRTVWGQGYLLAGPVEKR
ncbi:MAG: response regulator [Magnetococcales bacterium]|nr:response regulator [Magnetococcales bacterium]